MRTLSTPEELQFVEETKQLYKKKHPSAKISVAKLKINSKDLLNSQGLQIFKNPSVNKGYFIYIKDTDTNIFIMLNPLWHNCQMDIAESKFSLSDTHLDLF